MYNNNPYNNVYPIPTFIDILIIEIPFNNINEDFLKMINSQVANPYILFIYNPNIKEIKTTLVTKKNQENDSN